MAVKRKSLSLEMLKLELQPCQVTFATAHIGHKSYKLELKLSLSQTWRDSRERLLSVVEIRSLTSLGPDLLDVDARWKFSHCDALRLPFQSCFKSFNVKNLPAHSQVKMGRLLSKLFQRNMKLRKTSFTTPVQKGPLDLKLQCLKALFYPKSKLTSLKEYLDLIISRKNCNVPSLDNLMTPHSQDHKFHTVSKETNHAEHQIELVEEALRDAPQISSCTSNYEEPAVNENRTNEVNPELACDHLLTQTMPPSGEYVTEQAPIESTQEQSKNERPTPCNTTNSVYEGTVPNNDEHLLNAEYVLTPFHVVTFQHPPQKFNSTMQVLFGLFKRCAPYDTILTAICGATEHQFLPLLHPPFLPELHNLLGMLSSTSTIAHQRQACFTLLVEFGKSIETCLFEGVIPYTDARSVSIVPFVQEQKLYLQERAFSCFQLQLPRALSTDETTVFILLVSKVLSESTADIGLLKALECGDQCFVFHGFASYLATKNHMLEALVKVFPEHATAFVVLVSPSEKYHKDLVDSLLNDLPRRFQSKFFSHSYKMFEIFRQVSPDDVSSSQQLPGHMQALLTGSIPVDMSPPLHRNDSGFLSTPHSYVERITTDAQEESGIGEHLVSLYVCLRFHADVACPSVDIVELQRYCFAVLHLIYCSILT